MGRSPIVGDGHVLNKDHLQISSPESSYVNFNKLKDRKRPQAEVEQGVEKGRKSSRPFPS
jgi:hypothetical protein